MFGKQREWAKRSRKLEAQWKALCPNGPEAHAVGNVGSKFGLNAGDSIAVAVHAVAMFDEHGGATSGSRISQLVEADVIAGRVRTVSNQLISDFVDAEMTKRFAAVMLAKTRLEGKSGYELMQWALQ